MAQMTMRELCRIRDIPARCTCRWVYLHGPARFIRDLAATGCPWHATRKVRT